MPHSGGGGRSSGGSHSSHSSGGGSHSRSGSGQSSRTSQSYFTGCRTFQRTHRRTGVVDYIYTDYDYTQRQGSAFGWIFAAVGIVEFIIIIGILFAMVKSMFKVPAPPNFYREAMVIDSNNHLSQNEIETATRKLNAFKEKTTIVPYIEIISEKDFYNNGCYDLEDYAYNSYVASFRDEMHLLIVYCYSDDDANFYAWETMWGDDTSAGSSLEKKVNNAIEIKLAECNGKTPAIAISEALDSYKEKLVIKAFDIDRTDWSMLAAVGFLLIHGGIFFFAGMAVVGKDPNKTYEICEDFSKNKNIW